MSVDLRLIVITDRSAASPRSVSDVVRECLDAGAPAIQLRDKEANPRELYEQALQLRQLTHEYGALLFINDRLDVALAARADGAHLGPDDVPLATAARVVPRSFLLGYSTDDPAAAKRAVASGAAYIGCGAVFGTNTKKDVGDERIGPRALRAVVVEVAGAPVVGIGGIGPENIAEVARTGAAGAAAVRSVMAAKEPGAIVRALLGAFSARPMPPPGCAARAC